MNKIKNINHLLKKYSSTYVPGEKRSQQYNNMIRRKTILQENIHLLHTLNQELPPELQLNIRLEDITLTEDEGDK